MATVNEVYQLLSPAVRRIYDAIREATEQQGSAPTMRALAKRSGLGLTTVHTHVKLLHLAGLLIKNEDIYPTYTLTGARLTLDYNASVIVLDPSVLTREWKPRMMKFGKKDE